MGKTNIDTTRLMIVDAIVDFQNVEALAVVPIALIDNGTWPIQSVRPRLLRQWQRDRYWKMAVANNAFVVTGGPDTIFPRLRVTTAALGLATTFYARTDNIATLTITSAHGLVAGDKVWVKTMTDSTFDSGDNQTVVLSAPSSTTFTYYNEGDDVATTADTAGTVGALMHGFISWLFISKKYVCNTFSIGRTISWIKPGSATRPILSSAC